MTQAGNATLYNRVSRARGQITLLDQLTGDWENEIRSIEKRQAEARKSLRDQEEYAKELSRKLAKVDVDNIHKKEEARKKFKEELGRANQKIGSLERDINDLRTKLQVFSRERNTIAAKEERINKLEKKRLFCEELSTRLAKEIEAQEERAITTIVKRVNETLEEFSRKAYQVRFDRDKFRLNLVRQDERPVAKSTGENLLLNLSFISTLIWYCILRRRASGKILLPGASAPFIIDAPFGELDDTYGYVIVSY